MTYDLVVIDDLKKLMVEKKMTLSVAESVTSGHIQAAISTATEASSFFQGGITAYNLGIKTKHLNVEPISALSSDCVDIYIARQMAVEGNKMFLSNYCIGITGYASRVPEKNVNELFAFYAIAEGSQIIDSGRITSSKPEGIEVQVDYANQVILKIYKRIKGDG